MVWFAFCRIFCIYFITNNIAEGDIIQNFSLFLKIMEILSTKKPPSGSLIHNISLHPKGLGQ